MGKFKILAVFIFMVFCFTACNGKADTSGLTNPVNSDDVTEEVTQQSTEEQNTSLTGVTDTNKATSPTQKTTKQNPNKSTTKPTTTKKDDGGNMYPTKENDMTLVYDKDNKLIKYVAETYNIDSSLLVCLCSPTDETANSVWEFNGKKDSSGKLIRTRSTLKNIYTFNSDGTCEKYSKGSPTFWLTQNFIIGYYEKQMN